MVSTRRGRKGRSDPEENAEPEIEGEMTVPVDVNVAVVDETTETAEDQSSDDGVDTRQTRKPASPEDEKPLQDGSDLFVLDNTGHEGLALAAGNGKVNKRRRNRRKTKSTEGNSLTKLLPGYTAPMRLNTSSLDKYRPAGGIKALQRQAERSDVSTRDFVKEATEKHAQIMKTKTIELSTSKYANAYASFKKGVKRAPDSTAGAGWFHMKPTPMSEELKADISVIRNRNYLDPKRFYKSADKFSTMIQVGTVIEGSAEFFSSRLTKKQRRSNLTEEIMADPASADYARNKFRSMAQEKTRESQKRSRVHRPKRSKRGF
jgi:Fcf2 pre-rRNA processing